MFEKKQGTLVPTRALRDPFALLRQMTSEVDRAFDDWPSFRWPSIAKVATSESIAWSPKIDVFERESYHICVRAVHLLNQPAAKTLNAVCACFVQGLAGCNVGRDLGIVKRTHSHLRPYEVKRKRVRPIRREQRYTSIYGMGSARQYAQHALCIGGIERFVETLADELASHGHTVRVACCREGRAPLREQAGGVETVRLRASQLARSIAGVPYPLPSPISLARVLRPLVDTADVVT